MTILRGILRGLGYEASRQTVASAYAAYPEEEWCASWHALPDDVAKLKPLFHHLIAEGYLRPA